MSATLPAPVDTQSQDPHAIRCREKSRAERDRLEKAKAADDARRARDRAYKEARAVAAAKVPKTHCEFGGHPWIPENLITTERKTRSGRVYFTSRCRICGTLPKSGMVKKAPAGGKRADLLARATTIKMQLLNTCTDLMTTAELNEWRAKRVELTAERDQLIRTAGREE